MNNMNRWWRYLVERFMLPAFVPSAFLHVAFLLHYTAPTKLWVDTWTLIIGVITYIGVFLILRFSDELKDKQHDDAYYPDRPVQRGLLTLTEIRRALIIMIIVVLIGNALLFSWKVFFVLIPLAGYMTLMRHEFFMPQFIRSHILIYMVSHQLFVPIFILYYFVSVGRWPSGGADWLFIGVNVLMLMSVEVARKIRPRASENESRDTYSSALGRGWACLFLLILLGVAQSVLVYVHIVPVYSLLLFMIPLLTIGLYYRTDTAWSAHGVLGGTTIISAIWMISAII